MIPRRSLPGAGLPWVMALLLLGSLAIPGQAQIIAEPCPEGLYRDLSSEPSECRYLDFPFLGASPSIPDTERHLNPAECSRQGIQDALFAVSAQGGGTVHVPACTLEVNNPILVPSFTALKGAGAGQTVLSPAAGFSGPLIRVKRATDVRVADMTLDGRDIVMHTMETIYARHVLMERLEVRSVRQNGLIFNQSRHVSLRYSAFHDIDVLYSYNGVGAKDCYPDRGDTDEASCEIKLKTLAQNDFNKSPECATSYCPCDMSPVGEGPGYCFGYGTQYTKRYLVYSNTFTGIANDYCMALHARNGEVAGNLCELSKRGLKVPDAWDVYVHDNLFRDNALWGFFAYGPIKDIHPRRIHLYRNKFLRHGDVAIRAEGPEGLYLVHNVYEDNCQIPVGYCSTGGNVIVNNFEEFFDGSTRPPQTYICGGSSSEDILNGLNQIRPFKPLYADSGTCYQVLPIEVVDLSVREASSSLEITWRTENETAVAAFEVEESPILDPDEAVWASVGRLEAIGSPTSGTSYRWMMVSADLDSSYRFRVKQINLDGAVFFSPVVEWRPTTPGLLRLAPFYPVPASDRAASTVVVGEDREVRVELVGMRGERLATLFDGWLSAHVPKRLFIEVGAMPAGTVFVVVSDGLHRIVRPLVVTR